MPSTRARFAQWMLFVTPALWAVNYLGARAAVGKIGGHQLALARWAIALAVMLPFAWPEISRRWPECRREWPQWLLLGALGMWICGAFVYIGAQTTEAVNIGLLYTIAPVLIAILSVRLLGEHLTRPQLAGAVLTLVGVLVIVFKGSLANVAAFRLTRGDLWIAAAVISWTVYSLLLKRFTSVLGPFARQTMITAGGLLVLVPLTALETRWIGMPVIDGSLILLMVAVALLPGVGAYQAYAFVQRELGAARTGLILYLGPLYAAASAWLLLGERPGWFHLLGAMLILPGTYVATRPSPARTGGAG